MRYFLTTLSFLFLFACATMDEAKWEVLPPVNIPYEKGWEIVKDYLRYEFEGFETLDDKSGYLVTKWRNIKWKQTLRGGTVSSERARVIVRVEERNPFKLAVKVEVMEFVFDKWVPMGYHSYKGEIIDTLVGQLRLQE
jgi:hypothetical protein